MISWYSIKEALEGPSGWMPKDTGVAPKPILTPEQQQRKNAFWKGFGSHFVDPQSYKDLAKTYGAMLTRGVLKAPMLPYASVSYPVSWVGKGLNSLAYKYNKVSPAQYQYTKEVFDKINKPVELWDKKVTDNGIAYPESVKENPVSRFMTTAGEDLVGVKALQSVPEVIRSGKKLKENIVNEVNDTLNGPKQQMMKKIYQDAKANPGFKPDYIESPLKDPIVKESFNYSGLNPNEYEFKGFIEPWTIGGYGTNGQISSKGNIRTIFLPDKGYSYNNNRAMNTQGWRWGAPSSNPSLGVNPNKGSLVTFTNKYVQKYKNGKPVVTKDSPLVLWDETRKPLIRLREKGVIPLRDNTGSFVSGNIEARKVLARAQHLDQSQFDKDLSRYGNEVVRELPKGVSDTSDVKDFIPYWSGYNNGKHPHFVRKGSKSLILDDSLKTPDGPKWGVGVRGSDHPTALPGVPTVLKDMNYFDKLIAKMKGYPWNKWNLRTYKAYN